MRLRVDFGINGSRKEVVWWRPIEDFPKNFIYDGRRWEWVIYDTDPTGNVDYVLTYSPMNYYDSNYNIKMEDFNESFGFYDKTKCECGSIYTDFPQIHMFFCPKWSKI